MKKVVSYIMQLIVLTGIWIILVENLSVSSLLFGLLFSVFTLFFCYISIGYRVRSASLKNIFKLTKYIFMLIGQMAVSAVDSAKHVIKNKQNYGLYRYSLTTTSELHRLILANSVTLTPGTVSVSIEDDCLIILCIDVQEFMADGKSSLKKLETTLLEG